MQVNSIQTNRPITRLSGQQAQKEESTSVAKKDTKVDPIKALSFGAVGTLLGSPTEGLTMGLSMAGMDKTGATKFLDATLDRLGVDKLIGDIGEKSGLFQFINSASEKLGFCIKNQRMFTDQAINRIKNGEDLKVLDKGIETNKFTGEPNKFVIYDLGDQRLKVTITRDGTKLSDDGKNHESQGVVAEIMELSDSSLGYTTAINDSGSPAPNRRLEKLVSRVLSDYKNDLALVKPLVHDQEPVPRSIAA